MAPKLIADLQVMPFPTGTAEEPHKHVDAIVSVIEFSGLKHTVQALTCEEPY